MKALEQEQTPVSLCLCCNVDWAVEEAYIAQLKAVVEAVRHHIRHVEALYGDGSKFQQGYSLAVEHFKQALEQRQTP